MKTKVRQPTSIPLIALFFALTAFIAIFFRFAYVYHNAITFGYDQARDAYSAFQIANGDIKIQGPPVSLGGFFHGVLYFYLITPAYVIGHGNPQFAQSLLVIINILGLVPLFFWVKRMFNTHVALISCLLYAISFDVIQYSTWLSNPSPGVVFAMMFFFGLYLYIFSPRHQKTGVILTSVFFGLSIQSQFFLGYLIIPLLISLKVFKKKPAISEIALFFLLLTASISTIILSYVKFGPTFIKGFQLLFTNHTDSSLSGLKFIEIFQLIINRFAENFYRNIFPFNAAVAGFFGLFALYLSKKMVDSKNKFSSPLVFLNIVILSQAFIIPFGGQSTPHVNVGLQAPIIILSAYTFYHIYRQDKAIGTLLVTISIITSSIANITNIKNAQVIFATQKPLTIINEEKVVDAAYQLAEYKPFSINTIASPFWVNTTWSYLFNWYGQKKYGFAPSFHGRDQVEFLGKMSSPSVADQTYIVITEPDVNVHPDMITNTYKYEDSFSKVIETKNISGILIQKRQLTKPFSQINFVK